VIAATTFQLLEGHLKNTIKGNCHAGFIPASHFFRTDFEIADHCPR